MSIRELVFSLLALAWLLLSNITRGEETGSVQPATYRAPVSVSEQQQQQLARIRAIVLNQGDNPQAVAKLVQLARELEPALAAQLYFDLSTEYLQLARYDQTSDILRQLLNLYAETPVASQALLRLVQLYSSSEVNYAQQTDSGIAASREAYNQFALRAVGDQLARQPQLGEDAALIFQRAVTSRNAQRAPLAQGLLTKLKHKADYEPWAARARAEQWLAGRRDNDCPVRTLACAAATERPHLDGQLDENYWQSEPPVQFVCDDEFLYLAVRYEKLSGVDYSPDARPRTHDADLAGHDQVRIRLDLDRDYTTSYELTLDHRGWTRDRCWLDSSWNPQWYVAAAADQQHWTIEAALPWSAITPTPPQAGDAIAVGIERTSPGVTPPAEAASPGEFVLLLFD